MRMARGIARGMLMHISGNSATISVVHAIDVARLSVELQDAPGIYNITDGTDGHLRDAAMGVCSARATASWPCS